MFSKIRRGSKPFPTVFTYKRPFSSVETTMFNKIARLSKTFLTVLTNKGFFLLCGYENA